jgi:hypothetical protein
VYTLKREEASAAVNWVEPEARGGLPGEGPSVSGSIEVFIGSCAVRVKPGFDRALFADVCKLLSGLR